MNLVFKIFLIIHIISGTTGLFAGTVNIIRKKGDNPHKVIGKIFFFSMITVGLSAISLSIMHLDYFLLIVGVFTIYMTATGERYLFLTRLIRDQKPKSLDIVLTTFMALFGIVFLYFGISYLVKGETFGIVFIVFAAIGLRMVKTDIINYRGNAKQKSYWLIAHVQRMIGSYTAALTAFLVVNIKSSPSILPPLVIWLLPTAITLPIIFKWTKKLINKKQNSLVKSADIIY